MGQHGPVLAAVAALALGGAGSAQAATITVNTGSDTYGQHDTHCSLRDAVQAVNTQAAFGTCPAGTGNDTIVLPARAYDLTIAPAGPDDNSTGDLNIAKSVTIAGAGAATTSINAGKIDRIFNISGGTSVTISNLTLTEGQAPAGADGTSGSSPTQGQPGGDGGAILNAGTLKLESMTVEDCAAGAGGNGGNNSDEFEEGGNGGDGGDGGGVYSSGPLTLDKVTVSNAKAGNGGSAGSGGIAQFASGGEGGTGGAVAASGVVSVSGGSFSEDAAGAGQDGSGGGAGGAINAGSTLSVTSASFSSDSAGASGAAEFAPPGGSGGAIDVSGVATVSSSSFSSNVTGATAAGLSGASSGSGGAIMAGGRLTLAQDTFSQNSTAAGADVPDEFSGGSGQGGAVAASGVLTVDLSTFASNTTGSGGGEDTTGTGAPSGSGGAILAASSASVSTSSFSGNSTGMGGSASGNGSTGGSSGNGGAIAAAAALTLSRSTLSANAVGAAGSGTASSGAPGNGAAVYVDNGPSSLLVNDTLTGNGTDGVLTGTTFLTGSTTATLEAVTDAANQAFGVAQQGSATVALAGTLLSDNTPDNCDGTITDNGHNLSFPLADTSCPATFSSADPKLAGALANNGGPTKTLALTPGSSAIDAGPAKPGSGCPTTDQRGIPRPQGKACDIGAFEFAVPTITITTPMGGATYKQGQVVKAAYSCTEGGFRSFVATCEGTVARGKPIATASKGKHTFKVTATDLAGNRVTKTVTYTVVARKK